MTELKGTNVAAPVVPFTSDDKYATHDAAYGKGGFRSVGTIAERDAIPTERKTNGMVVAVLSDGKNYAWSDGAWEEWLPKGNVTVDQSLNSTSTNDIANKAVSAKFTSVQTELTAAREVANNAIPKAKIAKEYSEIATTDTTQVPSSKALNDAMLDIAITLQSGINEAQNTANAAIPKLNIAQTFTGNTSRNDLVPSTKAVNDAITSAVNNIPKITVDASLSMYLRTLLFSNP